MKKRRSLKKSTYQLDITVTREDEKSHILFDGDDDVIFD